MGLTVNRTGSAEYGRWIKTLICGEPGAGKTRFGRTWPNPFYANAEGGLMSVARDGLPYATIRAKDDLLELYKRLDNDPHDRAIAMAEVADQKEPLLVETVLIDTIDEVQRILIRERLAETKKDSLAMQDWGWLGDQMRGIVRGFRNLDMHVILTCHVKSTKDEESGKVTVGPALQGALGDEIPGYVDLAVLLCGRPVAKVRNGESVREVVRFIQSYPDANHPWIKDRSGTLPLEFELTFDDDYKRLDHLVYGDGTAVPPAADPVAVIPPEADPPAVGEEAPAEPLTPPASPVPPTQPEPEDEPPTEPTEPESQPDEKPVETPVETPAEEEPPTEPPAEEAVSDGETEGDAEPKGLPDCEVCGDAVDDPNIAELSYLRYHKTLCRKHFAEEKRKRK